MATWQILCSFTCRGTDSSDLWRCAVAFGTDMFAADPLRFLRIWLMMSEKCFLDWDKSTQTHCCVPQTVSSCWRMDTTNGDALCVLTSFHQNLFSSLSYSSSSVHAHASPMTLQTGKTGDHKSWPGRLANTDWILSKSLKFSGSVIHFSGYHVDFSLSRQNRILVTKCQYISSCSLKKVKTFKESSEHRHGEVWFSDVDLNCF